MNKQQREYTIERIKKIARSQHIECECASPNLTKHLRRAITAGEAKLRPAKEILALFAAKVLEGDGYDSDRANSKDLFEAPASYKTAMAELKAEQDKHAAENEKTDRFAQSIIDRIELGEFEDGKEAIRLMEAYTPKGTKRTAA